MLFFLARQHVLAALASTDPRFCLVAVASSTTLGASVGATTTGSGTTAPFCSCWAAGDGLLWSSSSSELTSSTLLVAAELLAISAGIELT